MAKCEIGSFLTYSVITLALAVGSVWHAFHTRKQFFPAAIYLTNNKINVVVLSNVAFMLILSVGKLIKRIFLGQLSAQEVTNIERKGKIAVTETCLALTTFREELNVRMVGLFTVLLFIKMFHWLAQMRVDASSARATSTRTQIRLSLLLVLLATLDVALVSLITLNLLKTNGASVLLLFGFEFMILSIVVLTIGAKFLLFAFGSGNAAENDGRCCGTYVWMFYLDLTADLLRLFLLLTFFMIICTYYGVPIHLIRELWVTFYELRDRVIKFIKFRRTLASLAHFPIATGEILENTRCTICLDTMNSGVQLPCTHIFHSGCLRKWLFTSQRCPNCIRDIPIRDGPPPAVQPPLIQPGGAPAAQQPVGGVAAPTPLGLAPNQGNGAFEAYHQHQHHQHQHQQSGSPEAKTEAKSGDRFATAAPPVSPLNFPAHSMGMGFAPPFVVLPGRLQSMGTQEPQLYAGFAAAPDMWLGISQRQTLMLQSHVDFLQAQLASTLGMLQQQLGFQETLMQEKLGADAKQANKTENFAKAHPSADQKHDNFSAGERSEDKKEKRKSDPCVETTSEERHESGAAAGYDSQQQEQQQEEQKNNDSSNGIFSVAEQDSFMSIPQNSTPVLNRMTPKCSTLDLNGDDNSVSENKKSSKLDASRIQTPQAVREARLKLFSRTNSVQSETAETLTE